MDRTNREDGMDPITRLLRLKHATDTEILRRMMRGKGPARYVAKMMRTCDVVHAIWKDVSAGDGYGRMVVSRDEAPRGRRALREAVFQVEDRRGAETLASDFGGGELPLRPDWALLLHVRDPDGGVDEDGRPNTMVVGDTSPKAARAFKTLGFDVR